MYRLTCDSIPLLDYRDDELILVNPRIKLEVNTVGEGSFTIYKNHPHYDSLKKLKSVFEASDDNGVIFRGRATGDTVDFDLGKQVDLEGAMAYFNDSVVRPFDFPVDFQNDANYIKAAQNGNVIAFFLGWLIDNHNSQVQDFQKMKLGNVTVADPNNYIVRSNSDYASTWETLKGKLFDSALGGYLCIRYEADGNYIDYLAEFTETNEQEIVYGENLLDLKSETEASEIYSAIIPIGALGLTLEGLADGNVTDDIVKSGDTLYSKKAVAEYGWIYAPTAETTWDDVTDDVNLRRKGAEWLTSGTVAKNAIEASAVDLHFTDKQVESLRIYKNVNVHSAPHGMAESFPLTKLEIELLNPQNTKITVGKTFQTLTDRNANMQEEAKKRYSKLSKDDESIRLEIQDEINKLSTSVDLSLEAIQLNVRNEMEQLSASVDISLEQIGLSIQGLDEQYTALAVTLGGVTITDNSGVTKIKGSSIETDSLYVNAANIRGTLAIGQLPPTVAETSDIPTKVSALTNDSGYQTERNVTTIIDGRITTDYIEALGIKVKAAQITDTLSINQLPSSVAETSDIPTHLSQLLNDAGYQTSSGVTNIVGGTVTTDFVDALGIHAEAAKIRGKLSASQIDATNLKVEAANVIGTLTASQIDASGLKVDAANVTGTLKASQIALTGAITFDDLTPSLQNQVNATGISAAQATTLITSTLVSSPNIVGGVVSGGKFTNKTGTNSNGSAKYDRSLEMSSLNDGYGVFRLYNTSYGSVPYFSIWDDGVGGVALYAAGEQILRATVSGGDVTVKPKGVWDFSSCETVGITVVFE